jgi:hypothetical protein
MLRPLGPLFAIPESSLIGNKNHPYTYSEPILGDIVNYCNNWSLQ